ncbi:MAG TPA: hypothetical protein VHF92_15325 [Geodermatophilus sp.]|nr:hypothetical protein [Geodermatophilus sp.]
MSDTPDERPRPTPRPRTAASARPTPRPRVAGSRREREETPAARTATSTTTRTTTSAPATTARSATRTAAAETRAEAKAPAARRSRPAAGRAAAPAAGDGAGRRRRRAVPVLVVLCLVTAGLAGLVLWQRADREYVDPSIFDATRGSVEALYAYDYQDSEGSVQRKLDVLTGDLREQYATDLSQGGIIDTYEQVSATTRYEVLDIGLQQVNDSQDAATLVVFGQYVVESVNSGTQPAPEGSECQVTPEGAQSCTQTVQVQILRVDGEWKVSDLTLLTTS